MQTAAASAPSLPTSVGQVAVEPCPDILDGAVCGHVARPWDPTGAVPGRIRIGFAFLPASDSPASGTVVAQEGGPGYPSTGSMSAYADLFAPLLDHRNLLVVDARGTGTSQAIDCPELQLFPDDYATAAGKCGRGLGAHSHLYGTDLAADDMAAVITALGLGRVDLYGDSYGTFFSQVFAGRHGDLLRTLVLDGAYPTYGEDAWYDTQGPALARSLATVCAKSAWCSGAGGSASKRFRQLLNLVRNDPLSGTAPAADGQKEDAYVDGAELAYVAFNATYVPTTYREIDAAARAALAGDTLPMLRLAAEADNPGGGVSPPEEYSEGLYAAVSCRDYPQVYDMMASPKVRRAQLAAATAQKERVDPGVYAPFTIQEHVDSGFNLTYECTDWPVPPADYAPAPPMPPSGRYPRVPTLVLNGQLDTITTPAEGRMVAGQFPNATWVQVKSGLHVTADGDLDGCASRIVQFFVSHRHVGDTSCARELPPLRTAPPFWRTVSQATPAKAKSGSATDDARLRAVTVAAATAADAMYRWWQTYEVGGLGLRGGSWTADGDTTLDFALTGYKFTRDLAVSGHVTWDMVAGTATVNLRLAGASAVTGRLAGSWDTKAAGARAILTGTLGGQAVNASVLAP